MGINSTLFVTLPQIRPVSIFSTAKSWSGTKATRQIHFWLTDKDGKNVFERTDTIRQLFMRDKHEKSVGTPARPFREKVAERLKDAKVS